MKKRLNDPVMILWIESDHLPVSLTVRTTQADRQLSRAVRQKVEKLVWDADKAQLYSDALRSRETQEKLTRATSDIDVDINNAVGLLVEFLQSAADCMKKEVTINSPKREAEWFDAECVQAKKEAKSRLRTLRRYMTELTRQCFVDIKRQYQKLVREKKRKYKNSKPELLTRDIINTKLFWKEVHSWLGIKLKQL
ncbi:hypothetical protein BaRGS_00028095, partial [Batillaria attramentaria]